MAKDLMFQDEIKEAVREAYAGISAGAGETVARWLYTDEELAEVPQGAVAWALGVGNPVRYAMLQPGEVVLDVGSGGGIDSILAARRVGPQGRVIGLDILDEMCERGGAHATEAGVDGWTEFRRGEMEDIPLEDGSVDVVISNGVMNLSARKSRAVAEIFRVLRPAGRISLADLTVEEELPSEIANDQSAWAG
jgi:SAM-dependent methyltransferase